MRQRHRWHSIHLTGRSRCVRCGTIRETIATVGIRYHRELRSYVRTDGIRFTGEAPECGMVVGDKNGSMEAKV